MEVIIIMAGYANFPLTLALALPLGEREFLDHLMPG